MYTSMSPLSTFVLLCCTVVCDSSQTCSGDSCKNFQLNKEHFNKRFRGPGLYEMSAPGHHDCVRNCFFLFPCMSIDYNRKDKMCKLNDVDSKQITASDFEQQSGAIFSDITAWPSAMAGKCGSRPCSKWQRCIPNKDTYHCADISCGGAPYIQNGKAVLLKPGKYLYGDTAIVLCDTGFSTNQTTVQCNILEKWEKAVCVKVYATNVVINKPTNMSSVCIHENTHFSGEKGVDGDVNQHFYEGKSCFCTDWEINPWWRVDLEAIYGIINVTLFNRMDCCSKNANNLTLEVGLSDQNMEQVGFVAGQIDDIHTFYFPTGKGARYVQVQLIGDVKRLLLCEVQVFGIPVNATNVALNKPTSMSSVCIHDNTHFSGEIGVDGDTNQHFYEGRSCFCTDWEINPWWRVDLVVIYGIINVTLFNRMDCCSKNANNLSLGVGMSNQNMEQVGFVPGQIDDIHTFHFPTVKEARYVQVQILGDDNRLLLCEVQVFAIPV